MDSRALLRKRSPFRTGIAKLTVGRDGLTDGPFAESIAVKVEKAVESMK
jgi:hypothetical protein